MVENKNKASYKLFEMLAACSGYELRRFRIFLQSPFFNPRTEILQLYDAFRPCHPEFEGALPYSEEIWYAVFPERIYDRKCLKHLVSDLVGLLEEFWIVQGLRKKQDKQDELLLESYDLHGLDKYFKQTLRNARLRLGKRKYRDAEFFYARFLLEKTAYAQAVKEKNRQSEAGMNDLLESLDSFYIGQKLRFSAAALTRENVLGEEQHLPLIPEILSHLEKDPAEDKPLLGIYHEIIRTLTESEAEAAFENLLRLLAKYSETFSAGERAEMYAFALNYCIKRINQGAPRFMDRLFSLYLLLLDQQLIFEDGELSPQHFKNAVTLGLRLGRFVEVDQLIRDHARHLPDALRENSRRYSMASLAFARADYGRALRTLQAVEFTDVYYHLDAKCLLLKTFYELEEVESLFSLVDTFRMYLRRNRKISEYQRTIYRNLVKFLKQLARHRLDGRKPLKTISEEVNACEQIADRLWLVGKIALLT